MEYQTRLMSMDIDGLWDREHMVDEAIKEVAKENGIKPSWMNIDLLLCMKLIAFRERADKNDIDDILCIINIIRANGKIVDSQSIQESFAKYYGKMPKLKNRAKNFIRRLK